MALRRIQTGPNAPSVNSVLGGLRGARNGPGTHGRPVNTLNEVKAFFETALAGSDNDVRFTAKQAGTDGNGIRIRYTAPASGGDPIAVSNSGNDITVSLAGTPAVAASLTTALAGANNDLVYTAVAAGTAGNSITVTYVDPGGVSATLGVVVSTTNITVNLGRAASAINSTAAQVAAAIAASAPASALVTVANAGGNDGTGLVIALTQTSLTGGLAGTTVITSTGSTVLAAVNASPTVSGLVKAALAAANTGAGLVPVMGFQSLAGGVNAS